MTDVANSNQKPRRRNEKFMLKWCEKHIPGFKDARARALASKQVGK